MRALRLASLILLASPGCETRGEPCEFILGKNEVSSKIPTVGVVEWSLVGAAPSSARIVYALDHAAPSILNRGGEAPVRPRRRRTIEPCSWVSSNRATTRSTSRRSATDRRASAPTTSSPRPAASRRSPAVTVNVSQPGKRDPGFIVTSSGTSVPNSAFIIDADGEIVWYFDGPRARRARSWTTRARTCGWSLSTLINEGGEMRSVSMDGEQGTARRRRARHRAPRLHCDARRQDRGAHRGGCPAIDTESDLVIRSPDGTVATPFTIGGNLYVSDTFHANAIHYIPADDSFTIADRNPNVFVKVSATGALEWQLGGQCDGAPPVTGAPLRTGRSFTGTTCSKTERSWCSTTRTRTPSHVFEFKLNATPSSFAATLVRTTRAISRADTMGDVQRLPGGNTLVTYSTDGRSSSSIRAGTRCRPFRRASAIRAGGRRSMARRRARDRASRLPHPSIQRSSLRAEPRSGRHL